MRISDWSSDVCSSDLAFEAYRGTDWMPEPCRSCERREIDWGGCRCQAFALTGEAGTVDPACALSPEHAAMQALATTESAKAGTGFRYRTRTAGAAVKQVKEGIEG